MCAISLQYVPYDMPRTSLGYVLSLPTICPISPYAVSVSSGTRRVALCQVALSPYAILLRHVPDLPMTFSYASRICAVPPYAITPISQRRIPYLPVTCAAFPYAISIEGGYFLRAPSTLPTHCL
eukprot:1447098-Rhodomonas_salina.1